MRSLRVVAVGLVLSSAPSALAAPVKVACIGASTTEGSALTPGRKYPDDLGTLLGSDYEVRNFGVDSTTILKAGTPSYWSTSARTSAIAYSPDIAVFWFGGNDTKVPLWERHKTEFLGDYEAMIHQFQALPSHPRTYVVLSLVFHDVGSIRKQVLDSNVIPLVKQVAADTRSALIDVHDDLAAHPEYFPDGVHPNEVGAMAVAVLVHQAVLGSAIDGGGNSADGPSQDGGSIAPAISTQSAAALAPADGDASATGVGGSSGRTLRNPSSASSCGRGSGRVCGPAGVAIAFVVVAKLLRKRRRRRLFSRARGG